MKSPPRAPPETAKQPHDALVYKTFSQPALAIPELQAILPPEMVRQIRWETLALAPGRYVDRRLRQSQTDLLYKVRLHRRGAGLLYVLFEHQSQVEPLMAFRLLGYMVSIWNHWLAEHPKARKIPAIIPVVLYHGKSRWTPAREFRSLIALPPDTLAEWSRYLPLFEYPLESLPEEPDEVLRARSVPATVKMVTLVLKHAREGRRVLAYLPGWRGLVVEMTREPLGRNVLAYLLEYLFQVGKVGLEEIDESLGKPPEVEETIMTTTRQLVDQGRLEGRQEGRLEGWQKGQQDGQRKLLLKQLRVRFGPISHQAMARINKASAEQLERWGERVITASSLKAVLAD